MKTALILAAGRGERLRPLTDIKPKALCEVHHIPLIEYHVMNLAKAGFKRLIVNHAHLGGQIREYLGNGSRWGVSIHYSPEPPGALETGGGIVNALTLLGHAPFVTVNADIFTDYDFSSLKLPQNSLIHLILIKKPPYQHHADFGLSETHHVDNNHKLYTFSGIACYHPACFKNSPPGRYSVTPLIRMLADKQQVTGTLYTGAWSDIGNLERLQKANR